MKWVVLVLLMISFVSAVDIDFDCPDEIFANEEFECSLEVSDGDGVYDVKVDLDGERNSALETYNDGVWKSGYYYLKEFIESGEEEDIKLIVSEEGDWDGELKLRQGDKREFFEIEIEVEEGEEGKETTEEEIKEVAENKSEEIVLLENEPKIVSLNSNVDEEVDELVYTSKNVKVANWLPYGFSLFLICVIGLLHFVV